MRQQATADRDLEQALDRLATAVIIVTAGLRVVFMNRAAAHLVNRCSAVTVLNNRLVFSDAAFATRLKTLTRRDSGAAARSIEGLRVIAAPLPPAAAERGLGDAGADALLFLAGPDTPRAPDSRLLRDLYGLSVAECRLAQELIGGASLDQVRERFRLSRNTVKTQLKSVFRKTGARSQGDLMRLFLSGPEADLFVAGRSPAPDSIE